MRPGGGGALDGCGILRNPRALGTVAGRLVLGEHGSR